MALQTMFLKGLSDLVQDELAVHDQARMVEEFHSPLNQPSTPVSTSLFQTSPPEVTTSREVFNLY